MPKDLKRARTITVLAGALATSVVALSACAGGGAQGVAATVTVTVPTTQMPDTPQPSTEGPAIDPDASTTATAGPLPPEAAGTTLKLANFFNVDETWTESRYDIADRRQEQGIGRRIDQCYSQNAPFLELRLANNFNTLKFEVGQSNASEGSDQILIVDVSGNNEQLDIRRVPFNKVQAFVIKVSGVNALRISFYLDSQADRCGRESVEAVLHDAVVN